MNRETLKQRIICTIENAENGYMESYGIEQIIEHVDEYVEYLSQIPVDITWMLTPNSTIQQAVKVAGIASVKFNREVSFIFNGVVMELEHFNHVDEIDGWLIESATNIYKERLFKLYSTLK